MMKKIFNNKFIIILIIVAVIVILFGVTYAVSPGSVFKNMTGEKISIDEEAYGETFFDSRNIELVPILDKDFRKREDNVIHISFLVGGNKNNAVDNIIYDIALNDLEVDCSLISPYVKWKLLKNSSEISSGSLDYQFDTIKNGRLVLTNIQQDLVKYDEEKKGYDYYDFYLWISDNCQDDDISKCFDKKGQDNLMGKTLKGKVEIELYADSKKKIVRSPSQIKDIHSCIQNEEVE